MAGNTLFTSVEGKRNGKLVKQNFDFINEQPKGFALKA